MTPRILDTVFAAGALVPEDDLAGIAEATALAPHPSSASIGNLAPRTSPGLTLLGLGTQTAWPYGSAPTAALPQPKRKERNPFWVLLLVVLGLGVALQVLSVGSCWTDDGGRRVAADPGTLAAVAPTADPGNQRLSSGPFAQAAPARYRRKNIEDLLVGDRIRTLSPDHPWPGADDPVLSGSTFRRIDGSDITREDWRVLQLRIDHPGGETTRIEMLRPQWWLEEVGAREGGRINLTLLELGIRGPARVLRIGPCSVDSRENRPGEQVVTATLVNESAEVFDLTFDGGDGRPLGVTARHPLYSHDRQAWVGAAELRVGEHVTSAGGTRTLTAMALRPGRYTVYNLEVHRTHAYYVSQLGLLAHNNPVSGGVGLSTGYPNKPWIPGRPVPAGGLPPLPSWVPPTGEFGTPGYDAGSGTTGYYVWNDPATGNMHYVELGSPTTGNVVTGRPPVAGVGQQLAPQNWNHVEGQAATLSALNNIPHAELWINHTGGPCNLCKPETMWPTPGNVLKPGQVLDVHWQAPPGEANQYTYTHRKILQSERED